VSAPASGLRQGRWVAFQGMLRDRPSLVLVGVLLLLVLAIGVIRPGTIGPSWVANTILFAAPLGIVAAGQTLVMLTAGIDLSVAATMTAAAYVAASQSYFGSARAVLLALAVGLVVGLVNGLGVAVFRVQPLIMTLGTGLVISGGLLVYSLNVSHQGPPAVPDIVRYVGAGKLLGIVPVSAFLWAAIATIVIVGLRQTGYGRLIFAVGDNPIACRLAGVRAWLVLLVTYVICGFLSGVAGLVLVGAINAADLSLGDVYLLPSVAAVVIGGTSIYGGNGGYAGEALDAFCRREIFAPLNMTNTAFNHPPSMRDRSVPTADDKTFRKRIIQGEVQDENASIMGGVAGHAGLFSTASDVATFALSMLDGGKPLLQPSTVQLFTRRENSPAGTSRALGWDTPSSPSQSGKYFSPTSFGHLGYTGTSLWIDPAQQLSVTLLTNRTWPDCSNQAIKQVRPQFHDAIVKALCLV